MIAPTFFRRRVLAAVVLAVLVTPVLLFAHARLERSTPAANSHLDRSPSSLALWFSERPEVAFTVIRLLDSTGAELPLGAVEKTAGDPSGVIVSVTSALAKGKYTVAWRTAAADGHPTSGKYMFYVDVGPTAPSAVATPPTPSPAPTTAAPKIVPDELVGPAPIIPMTGTSTAERWGEIVAIITMIGVIVFRLVVVPNSGWGDELASDAIDRARKFGQGVLVLAAVTSCARLADAASLLPTINNSDIDAALTVMRETTWGHGWFVGGVGMILAAFGIALAKSTEDGWPLALVGVLAMVVSQGLTGHAVAAISFPGLAVVVDSIHIVFAGAWIGGLILVVLIGLPAVNRIPELKRPLAGHQLVRSYHRVALVSFLLVVATGLINALLRLGQLSDLWTSHYGWLLVLKVLFVAAVASLGFYHVRRVVPVSWDANTADRFRFSASGEIAIAAIVLAVTALLVTTQLPMETGRGSKAPDVLAGH